MCKKSILILFLCVSVALPQFGLAEDDHRLGCKVCGMYIDAFRDTSTTLQYKDGQKQSTCGVACMLRLINDQGGPDAFTSISVHSWTDKTEVSALGATYVIGSRLIPDMIPNLIVFATHDDAINFQKENGGELLTFTQALLSISPMGMTMPARIQSAVLPARGATGIGIGLMKMEMDEVMEGASSVDPLDFVRRPGQMMGPKKMKSSGQMVMANYGVTDNVALSVKVANLNKKMEMYTMGGRNTTVTENSGVSDVDISLRYGIWKNTLYSKFFSLLGGVTLPTGDFDVEYIDSPGLQVGTGDFTGTAGALFSNRISNFWFHYMLSYTHMFENSDNYQFGDVIKFGAAIHYTPNYNLMFGLELDGANYAENEKNGVEQRNTGGFRSYATGVCNWKFLTALGGNFNIRLVGGIPIYEDMNHYSSMGMEKVQLGGGYLVNAMLSFQRRFPVH